MLTSMLISLRNVYACVYYYYYGFPLWFLYAHRATHIFSRLSRLVFLLSSFPIGLQPGINGDGVGFPT
jgi:hypothetical protein